MRGARGKPCAQDHQGMTLFDYAVLIIIGASVCLSLIRGLAREVLALVGWVIAFIAASLLAGTVAGFLPVTIASEALRVLIAFVAVFVTTLIAASLTALTVTRLIRSAGLGMADRMLGSIFGLARGLLIVMVLVLLAGLTPLPRQPAWTNALLSPPLGALAGVVRPWLPKTVSQYISYD